MKKYTTNWIKLVLILSFLFLGLKGSSQVTVSGAVSGNGTYTTLRNAFTAVNAANQTNAVINITVTADTDESTLTAVLNAGTWTSLTIKPTGARTISGATAAGNPIINLNGADNVTIDGLNSGGNSLLISNTSTSSSANTCTIRFIADASQNTITNCTIAGSEAATASGTIYFASGTTTGNDNNTISNCTITAAGSNLPINAIYSNGSSTTVDNSNNSISNNNIQDYFHESISSTGINLAANSASWTISGNRFFQTATRTTNTASAIYIRGITINTASAGGYTITNNRIGFANASGTGTSTFNGNAPVYYRGLDLTTNTTSSSIQGNVVAGINLTTAITNTYAPGAFVGIYVSGVATIGTISGNTIGSSSSANSIVITVIQPAIPVTTASRSTGIYVSTNSATSTIQNNTVAGISTTGLDTNGYGFYGINTVGTLGDFVIANNTIGSTTVAHSIAMGTSGVTATGVCTFYGITNASTGTSSITNNLIVNCTAYGTAASALSGIENTASSSLIMDYNTVEKQTLTGTGTFRGLYNGAAATTASMSYNTIRNYSLQNATSIFTGIQNNGVVTGTITINNNKLGDATAGLITYTVASSANLYGIYNSSGTTSTALNIQNNDFRGIIYSATSSGSHTYIYNTNATLSRSISSNTFTNLNIASSGSVNFISDSVALSASGNQTVSYNAIAGSFNKTVAGGTVTVFTTGTASATGATIVNNYNNFSYITVTGATTLTGWSQRDTGSTVKTISNNTFSNWTGGTNQIVVMYLDGFGANSSVSNNSITGITGQNSIIGINITGVGSASDLVFANNNINNISSIGAGGAVTGIQCNTNVTALSIYSNSINTLTSVGASTTVNGIQVSGGTSTVSIYSNTINSLTQSGTTGPSLNGIYISAGNIVYLYKNKIYDLTMINSTSGGGGVNGILINGATAVTAYNNIIGDLKAPLNGNTNVIKGISVTTPSTTSTYELDNNTIYLNATSSGTNFGSSGIFHTTNATSTISNLTLKNNLVINNSTANGTGLTVAYYRSSTELSNYNSASNNNLFYAGTPSTTNLVFYNGTRYQVLSAFQTLVSPRDSASKTENTAPFFQSTTPSDSNYLRIPAGTTTHAESAAVTVTTPTINTDYWNVTRPFPSPSNGGTASDIGASEFDGIAANCLTPSGQPTAFISGTNTSTTIAGSFSTAIGTPTGYLVVMSLGTLTANPTNGTIYSIGSSLGNGTVIQSSGSLSFSTASLTPNTTYTITVFAYNTGVCSASTTKYLTTSPLVGTLTTCSAAPTGSANQAFCGAKKLSDIVTSGTAVKYYNAASGGSVFAGTVAIVYGTTYYISQTINGCESQDRLMVTVTETSTSGDQVTYGADSWIGYVYSPISTTSPPADAFTTTYQGFVTQTEQFDQNYNSGAYMSGTSLCNSFTINYAIKFKMTKSFAPDYYKVTTGADDGYRFSIDGGASYVSALSNWTTHAYSSTTSTVYLNGSTNLVFDYYQQPAISRIVFNYIPCNSSTAPTTISGTTTICNGSSTTLTASGGTLSSGAVYQWGTGSVVGSNIIAGQTGASITVSPSSTTTYWVNRLDGAPCNLSTTGVTQLVTVVTIASNSSTPTSLSGTTTICNGTTTTLTASGGTLGTLGTYQWGNGTVGTNVIAGQNGASITVAPITTTTYWVRRVDSVCTNTTSAISQVVTVNAVSNGGVISSDQSICSGSQPSSVTLSGNVGSVIKWQKASDASFLSPIDIANTSTTLTGSTIGSLTATTYFRAIVQNGVCSSAISTAVVITVSTNSIGGTVTGDQVICAGSQPSDIVLSGNTGNVIKWQSALNSLFTSPTDIINTSSTLGGSIIGTLSTTTFFRAIIQNGGCASVTSSNYSSITVNPNSIGGTVSTNQAICNGSLPANLTLLGYSGTIVKWQSSTDTSFSNPVDITNTTATLLGTDIGALSSTTYYRAIIQNGSCAIATSNYATITVNATSVGGTVVSNQTICSGTSPSDLSVNGNVGSILKWQKASNSSFTSPEDLSYTSNILSGTVIGSLTATTYFRAIVQNGACSVENAAYATITVTSVSIGGNISSNQAIGYNTQPSDLTLSGNNGFVVKWQKDTNSSFTSPIDLNFTTNVLNGSVFGNLTQTIYVRAIVQNGSCSTDYSNYVTIIVDPLTVGGTVATNQTICTGSIPSNIVLSGNVGNVVKWQKATDATFTAPVDISNLSTTLLGSTLGSLTATTFIRAVVQSGVNPVDYSSYVQIEVNPLTISGTVTSDQSICTGSQPNDLILGGAVGTVLKWQKSSSYLFTSPIDITSSTSNILTSENIGTLSTTTYYRAVVQSGNCSVVNSNFITITVSVPSVGGVVSSNQTICSGTLISDLNLNNFTGNVIKWQKANEPNFTYPVDIPFTSSPLISSEVGSLTDTTYFRAVVQNGGCSSAYSSNYVTVTVNPASVGGTISNDQTICTGTMPTDLNLTGYSGSILKWQKSLSPSFTSPIDIVATSGTLLGTTIGTLAATTYFRAVIQNGNCSVVYSSYVTITINQVSNGGTLNTDQTICSGTQPVNLLLTGNTGSVVKWQISNDVTFTSYNDITNTTNTLSGTSIGNLNATTYFRVFVQNGVCEATTSNYVTISVTPSPVGGTINSNQTICTQSLPSDLSLVGYSGSIVKWQKATDITFNNLVDITETSSTLAGTAIGNLGLTTYFRAVVHNGSCSDVYSSVVTITVSAASNGGSVIGNQTICAGTQPSGFSVVDTVGTIVKWQKATDYLFASPIDINETTSTLTGSLIGNVYQTTFIRAVLLNNGCSTVYSNYATVSIISTVWDGSAWSDGEPSDTNITKSIVFTGNYTGTVNLYGCTMWVTNNANVVLTNGFNITLNGTLTVDSGSNFTMENDTNLIQNSDVSNSGSVTVKRKSSPLFRLDYTLWSSPVSSTQTLFNFSPLTSNILPNNRRFYEYNTYTNLYNMVDPQATIFEVGKGYLIRMPNNWIPFNGPNSHTPGTNLPARFEGSFVGTPNNGPYTINGLVDGGSEVFRYNAIGNPYPSTILIPEFISQNQNQIDGTIWLWRKTNDMYNMTSYSTCTTAGCTRNNGHTFYVDDNLISVGQGFLVRVKENQSTVNFSNSMRTNQNVDQFFRLNQKNRFWLDVTNDTSDKFGQLMVAYLPNATTGYDNGLDGIYINDCQTALTAVIDGNELAICAKPEFVATDVTPLQFKTDTANSYTISLNRTDGIFNTIQDIYIKDKLLGVTQNLKSGNYSFASNSGIFTDRFEILYQNPTLTTTHFSNESVIIYKNNTTITINSGAVLMDTIKVFDTRGRLLLNKAAINSNQYEIDGSEFANQVLIVQIETTNHERISKKVLN